MYVCVCTHTYIFISIYTYIHTHIQIHTHTHIHNGTIPKSFRRRPPKIYITYNYSIQTFNPHHLLLAPRRDSSNPQHQPTLCVWQNLA